MLRYLADAYKALRQTVPDEAKTEELRDLIEWLGELVRQVDSSLLDEWERLRQPATDGRRAAGARIDAGAAAGHGQRRGRSGCWCATRCSAGSSWPRCAALRRARRAGRRRRLGRRRRGPRRWTAYFDEHDDDRHRRRTPAARRC